MPRPLTWAILMKIVKRVMQSGSNSKNVVEKPEDAKYRSINTESNAYKTKVAPLKGGMALLRALGFEKNENSLDLSLEKRDMSLLSGALSKLTTAHEQYLKDA